MGGPANAKPDNIHKDAPTMEPTAEELVIKSELRPRG